MFKIFKKYPFVKVFILVALGVLLGLVILYFQGSPEKAIVSPKKPEHIWQIKSIDTMKYSRDLSSEKLKDESFDSEIEQQISAIKKLNASHVAIGTPYDERFIPILERWVKIARKNKLRVWFRGNLSGWEGWFGEKKNSVSRGEHTKLVREFIKNHPDLFENGDVFSPCPECENGGPGDPRSTGDIEGHRQFLISERNASIEAFNGIRKKVTVLDSMNFDIAKLVMDKQTAQSMGGIVAIDHYVNSPEKLSSDIDYLAQTTGAKIFLGEIGVPIPDIHGDLNQNEQSAWIEQALTLISKKPSVIGLNYWVAVGGSTAILDDKYEQKPAAEQIKRYFSLLNLD